MNIRDIAERLQIDLIESPREKPKRIKGDVKFVPKVFGDFGYKISGRKLQMLATTATSYENFILAATN
jgi:hypothetical protein